MRNDYSNVHTIAIIPFIALFIFSIVLGSSILIIIGVAWCLSAYLIGVIMADISIVGRDKVTICEIDKKISDVKEFLDNITNEIDIINERYYNVTKRVDSSKDVDIKEVDEIILSCLKLIKHINEETVDIGDIADLKTERYQVYFSQRKEEFNKLSKALNSKKFSIIQKIDVCKQIISSLRDRFVIEERNKELFTLLQEIKDEKSVANETLNEMMSRFEASKEVNTEEVDELVLSYLKLVNRIEKSKKHIRKTIEYNGNYEADKEILSEYHNSLAELDKEEREIIEVKTTLGKNVNRLKKEIDEYKHNFVKNNSKLYKNLLQLNNDNKFIFHDYQKECEFFCDSKQKYDQFDFDLNLIKEKSILLFYENLEEEYKNDLLKYEKYLECFNNLNGLVTTKDCYEHTEISFESFSKIELELCGKLLQNINFNNPKLLIRVYYTTPTGRFCYNKQKEYNLDQILNLLKIKRQIEEDELIRLQEKCKKEEERKDKERKLRELDKIEQKLAKKEQELAKKEQDFINATKGHIYTTDNIEIQKNKTNVDENLSLYQKLKILKTKLDNGEITIEEYQAKRRDLI